MKYLMNAAIWNNGRAFTSLATHQLKKVIPLPAFKESLENSQSWEKTILSIIPLIDVRKNETELHQTIRAEKDDEAICLIQHGANYYQPNDVGITSLHLVCAKGKENVLLSMIQQEYLKSKYRKSWLKHKMFYRGLDLKIKDNNDQTPLHHAAALSSEATLEMLLDEDINRTRRVIQLNCNDKHLQTPLHIAAANPNPDVLKAFLEYPKLEVTALDSKDKNGFTPLHWAVLINSKANVNALKVKKANLKAQASKEQAKKGLLGYLQDKLPNKLPPLWLALELRRFDLIPTLIENKEDLFDVVSSDGFNAIHLAAYYGNKNLLDKLIARFGCMLILQSVDILGRQIMHSAARNGQLDMIKTLVSIGANVDPLDSQGNLPLHLASQSNHTKVVKYLCQIDRKQFQEYQKLTRELDL